VTSLRFGQAAPGFTLPSTGGASLSLADFRGRDVVLVFYCYDFGRI
jgi:peroxiredoxin Q/BCP